VSGDCEEAEEEIEVNSLDLGAAVGGGLGFLIGTLNATVGRSLSTRPFGRRQGRKGPESGVVGVREPGVREAVDPLPARVTVVFQRVPVQVR
jgi:hypothetical protein